MRPLALRVSGVTAWVLMYPPLMLAQTTGAVLTSDLQVSWPVLLAFLVLAAAYGEARVHIASLRDRMGKSEDAHAAVAERVGKVESRSDRTDERVDHVLELLTEVRADVKQLLRDQGRGVA